MGKRVLIIDTSILMVWLQVPGKETCGSDSDRWDYARVAEKIKQEETLGTTFVLPLATIIEAGNHIAQCGEQRYQKAQAFSEMVLKALDEKTPWAAFSQQEQLWQKENMVELINRWRAEVVRAEHSLGDASIVDVANYYCQMNYSVEILTGDFGLKAYEPTSAYVMPRRGRK